MHIINVWFPLVERTTVNSHETEMKYNRLMHDGDGKRTRLHQPREAIVDYQKALSLGGDRDFHCAQMIGVCWQMLHQPQKALVAYSHAADLADTDEERGNLERDFAASYAKLGDYTRAETCLQDSLEFLMDIPAAYSATLGFKARLLREQGYLEDALELFSVANDGLKQAGAHDMRLYNLLHWASALSQNGSDNEFLTVLGDALQLIPAYGSPAHRQRAMVLLSGGWRADAALSRGKDTAAAISARTPAKLRQLPSKLSSLSSEVRQLPLAVALRGARY